MNHTKISTISTPTSRSAMVLLSLALSACGNGGGGGGITPPPPPVNLPPVAGNSCAYAAGINENLIGTGSLALSATDPEGQPLTYFILSSGAKGSATITSPLTGEFVYAPNTNSRGTDEFTFQACEPAPSTVCSNIATYKIVHTPRIMTLGDSITWGVLYPRPPNGALIGYRVPLKDALVAAGYQVDLVGTLSSGQLLVPPFTDPEHDGHGGWSAVQLVNGNSSPSPDTGTATGKLADWLNGQQDATSPVQSGAGRPDIILLHAGTNDLTSGYQSNLWNRITAIRTAINSWESSNWPVTVIYSRIINTNPAANDTTWFNDDVINQVVLPAIGSGDQAIWVNHESALTLAGDYTDNLHPGTIGYQKMANIWLYPLTGGGTPSGSYSGPGILPKCP